MIAPSTLVVLAGGLGKRMGEYTNGTAKALVPVAGEPFLVSVLRSYRSQGITDVILCTGHRAQQVQDVLGDGAELGLRIAHSVEPEPLGPVGALRHARSLLPDTFLLTYCDVVLTIALSPFVEAARECGYPAVMAVGKAPTAAETNVLLREKRVSAYSKNPPPEGAVYCDRGLLVLSRELLDRHPGRDEEAFYGSLAANGELGAVRIQEAGMDIGTADRYERYLRIGAK
ncbi:NTP transferase domain-containing protein [Allokutzneria sp. A3M-2-11 16]|uniref:nucleotidyltransferase family protein n=1 Tax=Allokutzneria sp. A3M-2-11 16 TaxID=2962043 RepID=UPI0020B65BFC|nr:NTP transferase domain-containing protein [Allokutzneria sp. A3M-2-11 16]MCP3801922.1 NTP transferase domain-containing protein [Allokutzneria sp. A3M-2-11 16]